MLAAFSITPLGVGDSVSESVAEAVRIVRDEVMAVIKACVMKVGEVAPRVGVVIKIDHRPGVTDGLHTKVTAVEERLGDP